MIYIICEFGIGGCAILTDEDTFELVPGGEQFASERIYSILPYDDKVFIGTRTQGFSFMTEKSLHPLKQKSMKISGALYLPGVGLGRWPLCL